MLGGFRVQPQVKVICSAKNLNWTTDKLDTKIEIQKKLLYRMKHAYTLLYLQ